MLRLHHSPMACSLASRLALAESGLAHDIALVRTRRGEHRSEAYRRINPRAKVPALETDRGVVTESSAILPLIADLAPDARLLPPAGTLERAKAQSWLAYLASTLHPALSAAMFPDRLEGCEPHAVKTYFLKQASAVFQEIETHLATQPYLLNDFSVCDLHLLVFCLWRRSPALAGQMSTLPNLDAFEQRLLARSGVGAIIGDEMRLMAETA